MADVIQRGTDTSGRALFASRYMWEWWDVVCDRLGFEPTIVQGAYMARAGGGAAASAGYHDGGGCFDLRTWDITASQVEQVIRVTREMGAGSWVRDHRHGMDPHIHLVLGTDSDLSSGARIQWGQYVAGRNGLASNGADYHWRPDPLVTDPRPLTQEDPMANYADQLDRIEAKLDGQRERDTERFRKLIQRLATLRKQGRASKAELDDLAALLED